MRLFLNRFLMGYVLATAVLVTPASGWPAGAPLVLENEFLKITVNNDSLNTGRFAIETTLGDPQNPSDNFQSLMLANARPWSSYTTIQIDGQSVVFGNATNKRAGKTAGYGEFLGQSVVENAIESKMNYQKILITQTLSFSRNPSTKVKDMVKIEYKITNSDTVPHNVGTRVMLDTWLGSNDGAPFRIGPHSVTSEKQFSGEDIVDFWQTFDSLDAPTVIAQGILKNADLDATPPSRIALVNWGTLADSPWEFGYEEGRSFVRLGESDSDTALALFWQPVVIAPGQTRVVRTFYGLGGVSLSSGQLSIGLAAPAEVFQKSTNPFTVVGYIQNTGSYDSADTTVQFVLPNGFKIVKGAANQNLGLLKAGQSRQVAISVLPNHPSVGAHGIQLRVESTTLEENQITRPLTVLGPLEISAQLKTEPVPDSAFQRVLLTLKNPGVYPIHDIHAALQLETAGKLAWFDREDKILKLLPEGSAYTLNWMVRTPEYPLPLSVAVNASVIEDVRVTANAMPPVLGHPTLSGPTLAVKKNQYFLVEVSDPSLLKSAVSRQLYVSFDPKALRLVRHTHPARLNSALKVAPETGRIGLEIHTDAISPSETVATLCFQALDDSIPAIELLNSDYQPFEKLMIKGAQK